MQTVTITATSVQDGSFSGTATATIPAGTVLAPRYARPLADVSAGPWTPSTGTSLAAMIDEVVPDNSDYIVATSAGTAEVTLNPVTDPHTSANQVVRYTAWSTSGGTLTVQLKQGSTVIAAWVHSTLPTTATLFERALTGAQCDAISDYTALRIAFVAG